MIDAPFDATTAKPHERHNRARAALLAYQREAGVEGSIVSGEMSVHSVLAGMMIDTQRMMIRNHGDHAKQMYEHMTNKEIPASAVGAGPAHLDSPDAIPDKWFLANIGGYDIYDLGCYSGGGAISAFLMIRSEEGGDYITTNFPVNYVHGFFQPDR